MMDEHLQEIYCMYLVIRKLRWKDTHAFARYLLRIHLFMNLMDTHSTNLMQHPEANKRNEHVPKREKWKMKRLLIVISSI